MKIRLIVPNQYQGIQPNPLNRPTTRPALCILDVVATYGRDIASIAGGFTATQATGGWVDGSNLLVVEPVTVFDCHCQDPYGNRADLFRDLARKIARELRQDCVYLEIDGEVEFVTA